MRVISERLEKLIEEMVDKGVQFDDAIREFEKRFIARMLGNCDGSLTKTADKLGIHRNTLQRKIIEYKLGEQRPRRKPARRERASRRRL